MFMDESLRAQMLVDGTECEALRQFARERSEIVELSSGVTRPASTEEAAIIEAAIYGACQSILRGGDILGAANAAEFICGGLLSHVNTYRTVHMPIRDWVRESEFDWYQSGPLGA